MKPTIKALSLLFVVSALLFTACPGPEGDTEGGMGNFTISFSGLQRTEGSRASVYPPSNSPQGNTDPKAPALSELEIEVLFVRPDLTYEKFNFRGDQEIKGTIAAGTYQVAVGVYNLPDRSPYAKSYGTNVDINIKSGSNDPIRVWLDYKEPVAMMAVINPPSGPSYQGCFPDLRGMVVEFTYADGTTSLVTDFSSPRYTAYAPGANSSGFTSIVEQGISPQGIVVFYVGIDGRDWTFSFDVDVVDLIDVMATRSSYHNQYSDMPYPDLDGITIEGIYSDSTIRVIPVQPDREFNWFETNEYYRLIDGVTPRRLVDPVSMVISYRVASNDADLPTREQSIGDAPRTTSGTEIFAEIHFDNFINIFEIHALGQPTKTYTASTTPMTIDWIEELTEANLIFEVQYYNSLCRLITMDDFKYAYDRKMASISMFDNFDLASSGRQPAIILQYFYREDPPIVSQILVTVPLNVVP